MNAFKLLIVMLCLSVCAIASLGQNKPSAKATPTPTPPAADKADLQIKAAQVAADHWLALVDAGKYAESWEQAAAVFKEAVAKSEWTEAASQTRLRLGKLKTRKVKYSQVTDKIQGAPAGQFVLLQTEAAFEQQETAKELVTLTLEKDGKWRVIGYFVQ